jgi:hypothetical protein
MVAFKSQASRGLAGINEGNSSLTFTEERPMNLKTISTVLAVSLGGATFTIAQQPTRINLGEGEAKARKILLESAAKQGKILSPSAEATATVTHWNGTIHWGGKNYHFSMLGRNPADGSSTTIIPVYVVPVKLILPDGSVWDPAAVQVRKGVNAIDATTNSPIFGNTTWMNGGVNLGDTQYIDAFQRGSWWKYVSTTAADYHVLFQPVLQTEVEWTVPAGYGVQTPGSANGGNMADIDINWFDFQQQNYIASAGLPGSVLPFFLTYNTCEGQSDGTTESPCFAGAYHSVTGPKLNQPYLNSPWEGFVPDLFILSHELGETTGDPFTVNNSPCLADPNMETGDPVQPFGLKVPFAGVTYHLEDLVFYDWFAGPYPAPTSVNQRFTFLGSYAYPCSYTPSLPGHK